ncbi:MAG: hypothetical protein KDB88_14195 [Flavobacteriales bacterium]|nr:hypothetical protein [Flavobacteriales bacterium]
MIVLPWILAGLLLFLLVLLATPFVVELDTRTALVELRWGWVGGFRVLVDDGPLRYKARVLFVRWTRPFPLGRTSKQDKPTSRSTKRPRRERKRMSSARRRWLFRAAWKVLRATRVRRFHLILDTDDVVMNAWLFPLFRILRQRGLDVDVRFSGGTELAFIIAHSPARVAWAMLRA